MTPKEWAKECLARMELAGAEASVCEVIEVIVTRAVEEARGLVAVPGPSGEEMTPERIHAIEQVLLVNADLCNLYEKRGVTRDALREVFRLATRAITPEDEVLYALFDGVRAKAKAAWSESQKGRRDFPKMIQDGLNVVVESVFRETVKAIYSKEPLDAKP